MLIVFALKGNEPIVVFFAIHLTAAVPCVGYTITVHMVMLIYVRIGGVGGGGGAQYFKVG